MRRKYARKKRRELLSLGAEILENGWIKEPDWERKQIGYGVRFRYNDHIYHCSGDDELEAYNIALYCARYV